MPLKWFWAINKEASVSTNILLFGIDLNVSASSDDFLKVTIPLAEK